MNRVQFLCADFRYTILIASRVFENIIIYCDPQYLPASAMADFTAYGKPFAETDRRDLDGALITAYNPEGCVTVFSGSDIVYTRQIYYPFTLKPFEIRQSVRAKTRNLAGEVIGTLCVCVFCGRVSVVCPDCGAVNSDATYSEMLAPVAFEVRRCSDEYSEAVATMVLDVHP
ncbi:MAG: DNA adenine methylase [Enterobacter sichuanensis]|uniref:Uncharacterized protein n=1 Tax=Enterobacter cloacae TaxID=550 RepID=A0AB37VBI7_ENTCL|nr:MULTISPECIES: DNA adenine methylase [Enterobacter cloacae complex]MBY6354581.1 DNA adenine methylase [Enterobacter sichuanensis]MDU5196284.1 DNA adenine methylase [Enterobacter sichuanensis]MDU5348590.1 DNA adenine methylase [Enterobacter sichuanensis]MDU5388845.1 DNA adenine methylase [Enterobacter sichuanensis]RWT73559.1 hypothetical protein DN595_23545 [Enterobacter cloacae]